MNWTAIWALWIGAFLVLEGVALRDKRREDTFGLWLTGHIANGWWTL